MRGVKSSFVLFVVLKEREESRAQRHLPKYIGIKCPNFQ